MTTKAMTGFPTVGTKLKYEQCNKKTTDMVKFNP